MITPSQLRAAGALAAAGAGGTVIHLIVNGSLIHERDLERVVGSAWNNGLRRGGRLY